MWFRPTLLRPNAIRRSKDKRTYTLYLHAVYETYPLLRPDGKMRVGVTRGKVRGKGCLLISLTRTTKREDENGTESKTENG